MKKILFLVTIIFIAGLFIFLIKNYQRDSNSTKSKNYVPGEIVEVPVQISTTPTPVVQINSIKDQIVLALSQKNNWDTSKVELNIIATEGDYAKGEVRLKDETGGGLWFAAKVNDIWKIVYDGNGIITCDYLNEYPNFPNSLVPQCYNEGAKAMMSR